MKNANWNNVVKFKDFSDYLSNEGLIQLSMSSSNVRRYYSNDIVKCFNFSPFVDPRGYKSVVIAEKYNKFGDLHYHLSDPYNPLTSDLTESKNQFVQDMKIFKKDLKKVVVHNSIDYSYLLYEIPSIFPNLTTLTITNSVLTIELLQYLLDNFKCLENLYICENVFIYKNEYIIDHRLMYKYHNINEFNINDYNIELPTSLRSLKLSDNMSINAYNDHDNVIIKQVNYNDSGTSDFYAPLKLFANLATFEYKIPFTYSDDHEDSIQFFHYNTQLKALKLSGKANNYELLNIIKAYENLTHLEYKCECYDGDMDEFDNQVLPSISYLHILAGIIDGYPLRDMFPNVTDLVIEYDMIIHQSELQNTIDNFPKLKSLKIISNDDSKEVFDLTLPKLNHLNKLEINLNYEEGKLEDIKWDISACEKLKSFTITKADLYTPFEKPELSQDLDKHWKCYYFPYKLIFIKNI